MNVDVTMPQLGETVTEGTVTRWLHQVGDVVSDQEPLLEIATDKVDTEVPSPGAGRLLKILIGEDETVAVGTLLAVIGAPEHDEASSAPATAEVSPSVSAETNAATNGAPTTAEVSDRPATAEVSDRPAEDGRPGRWRQRHSPRVRRLAVETGIRLEDVVGTGVGARITPADVLRVARQQDPVVEGGSRAGRPVPESALGTGLGTAMGTAMETAMGASVVEVDLTVLARAAAARGDASGVVAAMIAKAYLEALSTWASATVGPAGSGNSPEVNIGRDLVVGDSVIADAADLNVLGLARRFETLSRAGSPASPGRGDGVVRAAIRLTHGSLFDLLPVSPGQLCALGVGELQERPAVIESVDGDKVLAIRTTSHLALSFDARTMTQQDAVMLLSTMKSRLESADDLS